MICLYCRQPRCKCERRKLARFLIGALLVVASAIGIQWVLESAPHPTCNVSSQGTCFGNPYNQNGVSK